MKPFRRAARPALEQAVQLLRDSSDWNPALKAAAGGVAFLLSQKRIRDDNVEACTSLVTRIARIAQDLANHPLEAHDLAARVDRLKRCLEAVAERLGKLREDGRFVGNVRAQRDAKILRDCEVDINAAIVDGSFCVSLSTSRQTTELGKQLSRLASSSDDEQITSCPDTKVVARTLDAGEELVTWRFVLFSVLGQRCCIVRTTTGTKLEMDLPLVLFAEEVCGVFALNLEDDQRDGQ